MLVRARVKPLELLPEWAKCCEEQIAHVFEEPIEFAIDMSRQRKNPKGAKCHFCKEAKGVHQCAWVPELNAYVSIDVLDLDEGPLEAA